MQPTSSDFFLPWLDQKQCQLMHFYLMFFWNVRYINFIFKLESVKTVYIFPMHHLDIWELNSRCRANALRWLLCRIFYFSAFQITFNLLLQSSISEVCYRWQSIKIIGMLVADSFSSLIKSFYFRAIQMCCYNLKLWRNFHIILIK